mgnify:CR=1 FL=1
MPSLYSLHTPLSPTHFFDDEMAGSAHGIDKGGLTGKGREMIRRMEAKRMIVDLAHASAQTIDEVHRQGVVHRLLRPEVVLVEDKQEPADVRVTGFDLAKQMTSDATIALSTIHDDRLVCAAPEVVTAFSSAASAKATACRWSTSSPTRCRWPPWT